MSETETLKAELIERIEAAETEAALEEIRIAELGKKGRISDLLKGLGKMSPDERREAGPRLNGLRDAVQTAISARREALADAAIEARLKIPAGLTFDKKGNLYIADRNNHRIRKVDTRGIITTVAGNGTAGFSGDGGKATQAQLNLPSGVAVDDKGNIYISDRSNNRVRVVDNKGTITTFAGNGGDGYKGDLGPATQAQLSKPFGLALDKKGNLYIADRENNRVRKVNPQGIITTVAGDGGFGQNRRRIGIPGAVPCQCTADCSRVHPYPR